MLFVKLTKSVSSVIRRAVFLMNQYKEEVVKKLIIMGISEFLGGTHKNFVNKMRNRNSVILTKYYINIFEFF